MISFGKWRAAGGACLKQTRSRSRCLIKLMKAVSKLHESGQANWSRQDIVAGQTEQSRHAVLTFSGTTFVGCSSVIRVAIRCE